MVGTGWGSMVAIAGAGVRRDPTLPAFSSSVRAIDAALLARMRYSHRAGCPVATADLRYVQVTYYGFDRRARTGELVVHRTAATAMTQVFAQLYAARFPVQRMLLVDAYRGDDHASMAANNTSAYNCRAVQGGTGLVRARVRDGARPQPGAEPVRHVVDGAAGSGPVLPRPLERPSGDGRAW